LDGWVETKNFGRATGWIQLDADGRFALNVERGARVRLNASGNHAYQPCAATIPVAGDGAALDVHLIDEPRLLEKDPLPDWFSRTGTLTGLVYEMAADGTRRPIADAGITLDGLGGMGVVIAGARTGADGRYVLCGLDGDQSTYAWVTKPGFTMYEADIPLTGNTVADIELKRAGGRP